MKCRIHITSLALAAFALGCSANDEPANCDRSAPNTVCTIIGSGRNGYAGDEGAALRAELSLPQDTLTGADGAIHVLDWNNHRIRKVTNDGIIHHLAGRGELGGSLDDPANSDFNHPTGLLFDPSGQALLIAAWHNSKIRTISLDGGEITDSCGDGRRAYFGDGGPALTASLDLPSSIAFSPAGDLVVMDQANQVIRAIDDKGNIRRVAGQCVIDAPAPDGPGKCAPDTAPGVCPGKLAGKHTCGAPESSCDRPCVPAYAGDEGPALDMRIAQPFGQSADPGGRIAFDGAGNLYFADTSNALIRMIDTDGIVHRVAGTAPVEGVAQSGYAGDGGPALEAKLFNPVDLAFGPDGTLYFTDVYNHCVRAINPDGIIDTVAGRCGHSGHAGDGGPAREALFKRPYGLEWVDGTLLISDTGNNVVRVVRLP